MRKGFIQPYPVLLGIASIIFLVSLILVINDAFEQQSPIGVFQGGVLSVGSDMRLAEIYLQHSAKFANQKAIEYFESNFSDDFGCNRGWAFAKWENMTGPPYFCHVLNTREDPEDICIPDVLNIFQGYFKSGMDFYIEKYSSVMPEFRLNNDYEIMPIDSDLAVIFASQVYVPIRDTGDHIIIGGSYFRPSFKVPMHSTLIQDYNQLFLENIREIPEECASSYYSDEEVWDCIEFMWYSPYGNQSLIKGGYISDDLWYFWYPNGHCYALHLPLVE